MRINRPCVESIGSKQFNLPVAAILFEFRSKNNKTITVNFRPKTNQSATKCTQSDEIRFNLPKNKMCEGLTMDFCKKITFFPRSMPFSPRKQSNFKPSNRTGDIAIRLSIKQSVTYCSRREALVVAGPSRALPAASATCCWLWWL